MWPREETHGVGPVGQVDGQVGWENSGERETRTLLVTLTRAQQKGVSRGQKRGKEIVRENRAGGGGGGELSM